MIDFLLEIGFEEFPPSYLPKAAQDLSNRIVGLLDREQIFYRTCRTIYSSRRLGVLVLGLIRKQKSRTVVIQGPPAKLAYDADGNPTQVLQGFLKTHGLNTDSVSTVKTPRGEYVSVKKEILPKETEDILYQETPGILAQLEFPKTMVWNESGVRFPRPIRWIVALLDRRPLRFTYAGVKADRYSWPNIHFAGSPIRLEKPREYLGKLRHGGVIADPNERRKIISNRIKQTARATGFEAMITEEILQEINCSVEYPDVVTGEFPAMFLNLPPEVITATLLVNGDLIWLKDSNKFICVYNAKKKAADNIRFGYTQVVEAKMKDAHFFYEHDLKMGIYRLRELTKGMTWMYNLADNRDLGTIYDKSERMKALAGKTDWGVDIDQNALQRAAELCKADLVSEMVGEKDFTNLQGIMGAYYARAAGEPEIVAQAIKEHYLPRFAGDIIPESRVGAALAVCDKIDHVLGALLATGKRSSSSDPLAIRRHGYGAIQIIDAHRFDISIFEMCQFLFTYYSTHKISIPPNLLDLSILKEFFSEQMARYLTEQGYRYDETNSILTDWDGNAYTGRLRCASLKKLRDKADFIKLVVGQKRVRNILEAERKKKTGQAGESAVEESQLREPAEKKLFNRGKEVEQMIEPLLAAKKYDEVLDSLLSLRGDIDHFFDKILVVCEDPDLRRNRLALLNLINRLFLRFADLSQIVIESENK